MTLVSLHKVIRPSFSHQLDLASADIAVFSNCLVAMTGRSELEARFDFRAPEGFDVEPIGRQEEEVDAGVGTDDQRADRDRFEVQAIRLRQKHVAIDDIPAAAGYAFIHCWPFNARYAAVTLQ